MKTLRNELRKIKQNEDHVVELIATSKGFERIPEKRKASEMICKFCGCHSGWTFVTYGQRAWFCENVCEGSNLPSEPNQGKHTPNTQNALKWPEFCEIWGIGNLCHDVKFELVQQSPAKIDFIKKFCQNPENLIMMSGKAGTGKTYLAMAALELFIRNSKDCMFFTQKSLMSRWLETFKDGVSNNFIERLMRTSFLVVDDFGTHEPSPGFLSFFMDLIDNRLQWSGRGTIITTNLNQEKLSQFCGEALIDRFKTGQVFEFTGNSRREKKPI